MIFVTVGTTAFEGLAEAADNLKLSDEIIVQIADGQFKPQKHESFEYSDKFVDYLDKAEVVVTHGGAGTIYQLLGKSKKVVGVANNERKDLHQSDLLKKLSDEGYLIWCQDLKKLGDAISEAKSFKPKKYTAPECTIIDEIIDYIG